MEHTINKEKMYDVIANSYDHNTYYEKYRKERKLTLLEKTLLRNFADEIRVQGSACVLDVGCGDGRLFDSYLKENRCVIYGVDISVEQVNRAKEVILEDNLTVANFLDPDFNPDIMDGIVCMYAFYNFLGEDQKLALQKMYSCVRDGGVVLMNVRLECVEGYRYNANWCNAPMYWSLTGLAQILFWCTEVGFVCKVYENTDNSDYVFLWLEKHMR